MNLHVGASFTQASQLTLAELFAKRVATFLPVEKRH